MDYTGFGKDGRHRYEIDRPLTDDEKSSRLDPKKKASDVPLDWLSVIKLNSTYMELVDRWYSIKGTSAWQGGAIFILTFVGALAFLGGAAVKHDVKIWIFAGIVAAIFLFFSWIGFGMMRFDILRFTHYPIRLNRKNRMVYVTRPRDTVLTIPWDDLFLCVKKNNLAGFGTSWDVRAHVLADDGETVKETFTLVYPFLGDKQGLMQLWEFVRRYMEEPNGAQETYQQVQLCMPVDGRREGLAFGLVRTFAPYAKWPAAQLVACALGVLFTTGRWLAMYTSTIPVWPADVENACPIEVDDPYQKDWRDNGRYDFWELGWPTICFVIGLGVLAAVAYTVYVNLGA